MTDLQASPSNRRPNGRSPSYPALDLERAIIRAGELWLRDKQFSTPILSAVRLWGYKGLSGPAGMTVAALKKYGLVEDEGSKSDRKIRVTDLAVQIVNHPDEEARQAAVRTAALNPTMHAEMWAEYGMELPSDETLMWTLTRDQDFTETGAREFLKEYRQTIRFAKLEDRPKLAPGGRAIDGTGEDAPASAVSASPSRTSEALDGGASGGQAGATPGAQRYPVRLLNGENIVVEGRFPISDDDWNYFHALLGHMKPAFVRGAEAASGLSVSDP